MRADERAGESIGELLAAGEEALVEAGFRAGDLAAAEELLTAARDRAAAAGDRRAEAAALDRLGMVAHYRALDAGFEHADPDAEEALFRQALAIRREIGDQAGIAQSLFGVGLVYQLLRHDWPAAVGYFRDALALAEPHADAITRSEVHRHLGFYYLAEEEQPELAVRHLRASLDLREEHGDPRWIPSGMLALGMAEAAAGRRAEAVERLGAAHALARQAGLRQRRLDMIEQWLRRLESGEPFSLR
jgi:tetratricopeptide (TPR) repeat protein